MVGGPLIVARLLNLLAAARIEMVTGTMIGCGVATMISALGLGFIGPRLPIVMGVFYIFIGPIVAISKDVSLAAAMTALMIGGLVQFAWSPLIGKLQRFFPAIVTGTTILLIGTGLMKIGINVATGLEHAGVRHAADARPGRADDRAHHRDQRLRAGLHPGAVAVRHHGDRLRRLGRARPAQFPKRDRCELDLGAQSASVWRRSNGRGSSAIITVIVCFFATAVETTGHTLAVCRITGVPGEDWRIRGAVSNDGLGSVISALFGGMALTSYSQNIGVISLTGVGSRFVVAAAAPS